MHGVKSVPDEHGEILALVPFENWDSKWDRFVPLNEHYIKYDQEIMTEDEKVKKTKSA